MIDIDFQLEPNGMSTQHREKVLENDNSKTLCNFSVRTYHKLEHNKLYIIIAEKQREWKMLHNQYSMLI